MPDRMCEKACSTSDRTSSCGRLRSTNGTSVVELIKFSSFRSLFPEANSKGAALFG